MSNNKTDPQKNNAILYLPVKKKFLSKWEYYQVDFDAMLEMFPNLIFCSSIWGVLKNCWRVNLIYCWWWHRSLPIIMLAKILGVKTATTGAVHMFDLSGGPDFYNSGILFRLFTRWSLALCDLNLFISYDQFRQITSHIYVKNPVVVRSCLVKKNNFSCADIINKKRELGKPVNTGKDKIRFLTVAWQKLISYKRKGVFEVLSALALLKEKHNVEFEWYIIGESGDGIDFLKSKIAQLQLTKNIYVVVDVSQEEKENFYFGSDLYIQPSWCEGFGNAVLEAMSFGLPALVSRFTAQPEVVGESGFIVMDINPQAISQKLLLFANMDLDARLCLIEKTINTVNSNFLLTRRIDELKKIFTDLGVLDAS